MKIYLIRNKNISGLETLHRFAVSDLTSYNYSDHNQHGLTIENGRTLETRGYPLSPFELTIYHRHYAAWKDLVESNEEYALVLENVNAIHFTANDLDDIIASFESEWDVIFPFNGFNKKEKQNPSFTLGFRWGTDAYFVNRKCLPQLLNLRIIYLPVDEQLLLLSSEGLINVQYENDESNILSFGDDSKYLDDCNQSKLDQILRMNLWSPEDRASIRTLLADLCELLYQKGITFFISEGTLLGYIRHKEIMPWDDDLDISISSLDIEKLVEVINNSEKYRITKWFWGRKKTVYYKISHCDSIHVRNLPYGFPFIDIWLYETTYEHIVYNHGFKVPADFIFPVKRATFEQTNVCIPNKPIEYLDLKYQDWKEKITVYRWCHKDESPNLFPLSAKISVDEIGLFYKSS